MSPEQWKKVKAIVQEALDRSPSERTSYLDAACGSDASLRQEVESLLDFDKSGLLDKPAADALGELQPTVDRTPAGNASDLQLAAGDVLAGRYRIIDALGKGGMGEVYRAHDLTLEQDVALKFLPQDFQQDPSRLARFRNEVRTAREISHRNVCRVYDIGEIQGQTFLSMEYIDGEDLGSLLHRIGRLPSDKAVEVAHQLCMGLAAAHEKAVLHRDLKPANVMIDGQGAARITDFGLAAAIDEVEGSEIRVGTPAYMSPEQSSGKEVTVQSDLYSLGLVLYQLFTGKRAFSASTPEELVRLQRDSTPTSPSSLVEGIDPTVERAILRCLDPDPSRRPPSAIAVAAALPGGDPLAAALAAGETPSPELVADAGAVGGLTPAVAWACLAGVITMVLLSIPAHQMGMQSMNRLVPLSKSPEVLRERASEIANRMGPNPPVDSTYGFSYNEDYLDYLEAQEPSPKKYASLRTAEQGAVRFWYRQSPSYLVPHRVTPPQFFPKEFDPPNSAPGMVLIELDLEGRLRRFDAVPLRTREDAAPENIDWRPLFLEAGLELNEFSPTPPDRIPAVFADELAAWDGTYSGMNTPIRIEAAGCRGRPVAFEVIEPWSEPEAKSWVRPSDMLGSSWGSLIHMSVYVFALVAGALLARRNLGVGSGDRRAAIRLALFTFFLTMLQWLFAAHHVPTREEVDLFLGALYVACFTFALVWVLYMALEPYVRRVWPQMMISWVRLMAGRFRDPLVGRDVLIGCLVGGATAVLWQADVFVSEWLAWGVPRKSYSVPAFQLDMLSGLRESLATLFLIPVNSLKSTLFFVVVLFLLRLLLRRTWLAIAAYMALMVTVYNLGSSPIVLVSHAFYLGLWVFVLFRFGWISAMVSMLVADLLLHFPLTFDFAAWTSSSAFPAILVIAALTIYGFKVSLAGRPAFKDLLADA